METILHSLLTPSFFLFGDKSGHTPDFGVAGSGDNIECGHYQYRNRRDHAHIRSDRRICQRVGLGAMVWLLASILMGVLCSLAIGYVAMSLKTDNALTCIAFNTMAVEEPYISCMP